MTMTRLMGAAAVAALLAGAANAQTPQTPPTEQTTPAAPPAVSATPPAVTPPTPATPSAAPTAATPAAPAAVATPAAPALVAKGDVVETLKADGRFKTLIKALDATNMTSVLKSNRNLTVFAPTDAAFAALPPGELDKLMKDPPALQKLLTYHVVNATVDSTKIKGAKGGVKTVAGSEVVLDGSGEGLKANTASIVQADVRPTNGTIHVVDAVLTPETAPSAAATTGATTDAAATAPATPEPAAESAPAAPAPVKPAAEPATPSTTPAPAEPEDKPQT